MLLSEKYRPTRWSEVVGQVGAIRTIESLRDHGGLAGRAYWITGSSGTGKTTIARLLAHEIADPFFVNEVDSQEVNQGFLRDLAQTMRLTAWGKGGRALIVNEAHGLSSASVRTLLVMLDPLPSRVAVIFTTTTAGEAELIRRTTDWHPLVSRCADIRLDTEPPGIAEHAKRIAESEGLGGAPLSAYRDLADRCRHNLREMLQRIEGGECASPRKVVAA